MKGRERWEQDVRDRQRNVVFPDTVRNEGNFYRDIVQGRRRPTPVQRVGAFLLGAMYLALIASFVWFFIQSAGTSFSSNDGGGSFVASILTLVLIGLLGLLFGTLGWKLIAAAFRR